MSRAAPYSHAISLAAAGILAVALSPAGALADGGVVRAMRSSGDYQISVFTSPNPLVAGPVDLSVLVQDAATLATVAEVDVEVAVTPRERPYAAARLPATREAATNKLFLAVWIDLEPGWHDVEVRCHRSERSGSVRFAMQVGAPRSDTSSLWPWYTWPVVPVALFAMHRVLARSPRRRL
ncbi:MAG: hypothetical protein DWQ37_16640 [Planctomycetota bacterium]|nr:MAG: hypothetical protein DWQ37_16640 [Planctomycetota bacterium]